MNAPSRTEIVVLVVLLVWGLLSIAHDGERSARARSAAAASESLAHDGDLVLTSRDVDRQAITGPLWVRRAESHLVPVGASFLLVLLGVPFAWLLDLESLAVAQSILEWLLLVAAILWVSRRAAHSGPAAPVWLLTLLFGSSAWLFFGSGGDLTSFALALLAGGACLPREEPTGDVYAGELEEDAPTRPPLRALLTVALPMTFLLVEEPVHAVLLLPLALVLKPSWRLPTLASIGVGLAVVGGLWLLLSGLGPGSGEVAWLSDLEQVSTSTDPEDVGRDIAPRRRGELDGATLGFALLHLLDGPRSGLIVGALPLLLVFGWCASRSPAARGGALSIGLAVVLLLALRPFDVAGGPDVVGNRLLLPALAFLGVLCISRASVSTSVLVLVAAQLLQWPAAQDHLAGFDRMPSWRSAASWVPPETTQSLVGAGEGVLLPGGVWVRPWSEAALRVRGDRWNTISIARELPINEIVLELGRGAPAQIEVRGGEVEELMFTPDDTVLVQVRLEASRTRHRAWWSDDSVQWYRLDVRPRGEGAWGFSLRPGRLR